LYRLDYRLIFDIYGDKNLSRTKLFCKSVDIGKVILLHKLSKIFNMLAVIQLEHVDFHEKCFLTIWPLV